MKIEVVNAGNCMMCGKPIKLAVPSGYSKLPNIFFCQNCSEKIYGKMVKELPPVNPQEPKIGHWIDEILSLPLSDGSKECVRCSKCGLHYDFASKYCPNCGAKMESEGKE